MGDPKKHRRKYSKPSQRWLKSRIEEQKVLINQYGLKNKKEIYKFDTKIRKLFTQAKKLIRERGTPQAILEEKQLLDKIVKWGILEPGSKVEDVLGLTVHNILDRRLQTIVLKLGLALSVKQSRQFISHGHVFINGKKVDVPSYIVLKNDKVEYNPKSAFNSEKHPERAKKIVEEEIKEASNVETNEEVMKKEVKA